MGTRKAGSDAGLITMEFDGVIAVTDGNAIISTVEGAFEALRELKAAGYQLQLLTMRGENETEYISMWLRANGVLHLFESVTGFEIGDFDKYISISNDDCPKVTWGSRLKGRAIRWKGLLHDLL